MKAKTLTTLVSTMLLALFLAACGGNDPAAQEAGTPAAEQEDHEHGEGTHTHEMPADTAGTYADTTGAFFSEEDSAEADHAHGSDTHEH